jgi:hypothetical protein
VTLTGSTTTWRDEPALRVVGGAGLRALVVPGRGGKIASLRDAAGREWLAEPGPTLPAPARGPVTFVDAEMCGWDECAPTVDADVLAGATLPDHGEAWTTPWTPRAAGAWGYDGLSLRYRFSRRVEPTSAGLKLVYTAEALGDEPVPFQWAAHPQLVAPPGSRIVLPPQVLHVDGVYGVDRRQPWTEQLARVDSLADGEALKFWTDPEQPVSWAGLLTSDGAMLRLSWDSAQVPYLALWVDAGLFSRERVVALEPSTRSREALSASLADGRCQWLQPGLPVTWSVHVEVSPAI